MLPVPPPIYPLPPQGRHQSDADYQRMQAEHRKRLAERDEAMKSSEAMLIVMAGSMALAVLAILGFTLFISGGIKAILGALAVCGLLWVAYVQVRRLL